MKIVTQPLSISISGPAAPGFIAHARKFLGLLLAVGAAGSAHAQNIYASGTLSATPGAGNTWDYTMVISDASNATSPIGSFWYAWVPGQFYLPSSPSSATAATGWGATIAPSGSGQYSIQFIASSSAYYINPGSSLTFHFVSTDTPSVLAGNAPNFPSTPIGTTVAYNAGLFSQYEDTFVVQSVPEPASAALVLAGMGGLGAAGWRRRGAEKRS